MVLEGDLYGNWDWDDQILAGVSVRGGFDDCAVRDAAFSCAGVVGDAVAGFAEVIKAKISAWRGVNLGKSSNSAVFMSML